MIADNGVVGTQPAPTITIRPARTRDVWAIRAGHWTFDPAQTTGVLFPGGLPLDEVLFFVVVPVCAVLGFEAVRAVLRLPAGDE